MIPAIGGVAGFEAPDLSIRAAASVVPTNPTTAANFGAVFGNAVDGTQALQSVSNELAIKAVTGDLDDIHDATIASTQAQVMLELVAAVRNKGVEAFNEIMRMQA